LAIIGLSSWMCIYRRPRNITYPSFTVQR